jgi:hypothetical protein
MCGEAVSASPALSRANYPNTGNRRHYVMILTVATCWLVAFRREISSATLTPKLHERIETSLGIWAKRRFVLFASSVSE